MTPSPDDVPSLLGGRYEIERELGRGASAFVYLARDRMHDRRVAVKVLRPELAESVSAERFVHEIRLTARLEHIRIVTVLDAGDDAGRLYLVTKYLDGGTLRERLTRERQLPINVAVAIAHAIATALAYAHEQGLVHRDVKPENILFSGGSDGEPCLADFGIARVLGEATGWTTSTGLVRGTPAYMSPEQASGERELDGRSDVYALGCVLYEMLAGVLPFGGATAQAMIAQRFVYAPEPLGRYRATVPEELEAVVMQALAASPADRWQTARGFAEALSGTGLAHSGGTVLASAGTAARRRITGAYAGAHRKQVALWARERMRAISLAAAALAVIVSASAYAWTNVSRSPTASAVLDTAQIVLLPPEIAREARDHDLVARQRARLFEAFRRWQGLTVVDPYRVEEAVARDSLSARTIDGARKVARVLGAARYVRTRIEWAGDSLSYLTTLYDVANDSPLYQVTRRLSAGDGAEGVDTVFDAMTDSLLLRGRGLKTGGVATRSLPAAQCVVKARAALDRWALAAADSFLVAASSYEPNNPRLLYWLAQVRAWRGDPAARWRSIAAQAVSDTSQLVPAERPLAKALAALGNGQYDAACRSYERVVGDRPNEFPGWYGLAQCRDLDHAVIRDQSSPSGWRFRSSYWQSMLAYARAFEALPEASRGMREAAFQSLRDKFFTSQARRRGGHSTTSPIDGADALQFLAHPTIAGDSLRFTPYPLERVASGESETALRDVERAVAVGRAMLLRITGAWAAALPSDASAKEAVAVSLELLGDAAAADSFRVARTLSRDPDERLQLAVSEAIARVKFALPNRRSELKEAVSLIDSLLTNVPSSAANDRWLAPIAALTGRCERAVRGARAAGEATLGGGALTPRFAGEAAALVTATSLGCESGEPGPLSVRMAPAPRGATGDEAARAADAALARAVILQVRPDSATIARLAGRVRDYLVDAQYAILRGDVASARHTLIEASRGRGSILITPDAVLPEARLWLTLADTNAAQRLLDTTMERVTDYPPNWLADPPVAASFVRLALLREQIAVRRGALTAESRFWQDAILILWSEADVKLRSEILAALGTS